MPIVSPQAAGLSSDGRPSLLRSPRSAVTKLYRASRDLFLSQRFARHVSPLTTTICTHPGDQEQKGLYFLSSLASSIALTP